jgi:hypothetical protein
MVSKDFKILLQQYAPALFDLHYALQDLKYSLYHQPILRYSRGIQSDWEPYFGTPETPPAPLEIVWATPCETPSIQPPAEVQQRAVALLQEINDKRELVALYRCGHVEGNKFILGSWLIPFSAGYDKGKGDGSGIYYTVSREGVLGLAPAKYAENKKLCVALL